MKKKILTLIMLGLGVILFLVMPNISALGITPGRTTIDFIPNLEKTIQFNIINSEEKDMDLAFMIRGESEDIIKLDKQFAHFNPEEKLKNFQYQIKLPKKMSPGLHKFQIIAIEVPKNIDDDEIIVTTVLSVITQLYVYVPYPEKYIDATLNIVNDQKNNIYSFYIPVINRGKQKIDKVKGDIKIYKEEKEISKITTNYLSLLPGERKELLSTWQPDIEPGQYSIKIILNYDENELILEKKFEFGKEFIKILGVGVNDFKLGEVAKIKILVQNKQSGIINKANVHLNISDEKLAHIIDLKSEDYQIPGLANKELLVYWDTEGIDEGRYDSELKLNYDKKFSIKNLKIDISKNSMIFTGIGFVISKGNNKFHTKNMLIIVIGILILANLLWFFWWIRKKKK